MERDFTTLLRSLLVSYSDGLIRFGPKGNTRQFLDDSVVVPGVETPG